MLNLDRAYLSRRPQESCPVWRSQLFKESGEQSGFGPYRMRSGLLGGGSCGSSRSYGLKDDSRLEEYKAHISKGTDFEQQLAQQKAVRYIRKLKTEIRASRSKIA